MPSFPLRERGLKHIFLSAIPLRRLVVPLAGTWIETPAILYLCLIVIVVPLAGTWIETIHKSYMMILRSVVPLAGTWIETKD